MLDLAVFAPAVLVVGELLTDPLTGLEKVLGDDEVDESVTVHVLAELHERRHEQLRFIVLAFGLVAGLGGTGPAHDRFTVRFVRFLQPDLDGITATVVDTEVFAAQVEVTEATSRLHERSFKAP